jgi:WD40 repeat protein
VRIWSFEEQKLLGTLCGHSDNVQNVKLSKDGLFAISASDDFSAKVWSLKERREVACIQGHTNPLSTAAL